jgi:uncharacterized protein (DUF1697 family)
MITCVALVRGINVGGHKMVAMSDLRDLVTALGLESPRTLLQSGNLVFRTTSRSTASIEQRLETAALQQLGLEADFFVRTAQEWKDVIDRNPFPDEAKRDPGHLLVVAMKGPLSKKNVRALQAAIPGRERIHADGRHAYIVYPDGIGRSKLTGAMVEKYLGSRGTARNWNTVLKIEAAMSLD